MPCECRCSLLLPNAACFFPKIPQVCIAALEGFLTPPKGDFPRGLTTRGVASSHLDARGDANRFVHRCHMTKLVAFVWARLASQNTHRMRGTEARCAPEELLSSSGSALFDLGPLPGGRWWTVSF